MDELLIGDEKYISTKRAAKITGYAKDYVGQLCREGRVSARQVGRAWYVLETAIKEHRFGEDEKHDDAKKHHVSHKHKPETNKKEKDKDKDERGKPEPVVTFNTEKDDKEEEESREDEEVEEDKKENVPFEDEHKLPDASGVPRYETLEADILPSLNRLGETTQTSTTPEEIRDAFADLDIHDGETESHAEPSSEQPPSNGTVSIGRVSDHYHTLRPRVGYSMPTLDEHATESCHDYVDESVSNQESVEDTTHPRWTGRVLVVILFIGAVALGALNSGYLDRYIIDLQQDCYLVGMQVIGN